MNIDEALDIVVGRTKHERFRWLCREDNPDVGQRDRYRDQVMRLAGEPSPQSAYPSTAKMAGNAAKAMIRAVGSGFKMVDREEQGRRLEICQACPEYDAEKARCRKCGCFTKAKSRLATEHCPIGKW